MFRPTLTTMLLCLAGPALALPWDGTYRLSEEADCERVGEDGGALRIAEGVFQGVEASCRMTQPVDVLDLDATLYVMECEGEGSTWSERAMFMKAAEEDAIFVLWRGYAFRYDRCPDPEAVSAEGGEDATDGNSAAEEDASAEDASGDQDAADGEDGGASEADASAEEDGSDTPAEAEEDSGDGSDADSPADEGEGG